MPFYPLISIIVPCYNVEPFIVRCIESLINQTLKEIEIILVDDGSPDNSGVICDKYAKKDSRITVIHKKNGGLAAARNSGQDIAKGETLMFVDADDYLEPNCCELAYKTLINKKVDCVLFNQITEYKNSSVPYISFENKDILFDQQGCKELQKRVLNFNGKIAQVFARIIKKDMLDKYNIRHVDHLKQGAEGFVFNIALFEHLTSAYYLAKPLYHYRYNEQSISHTPNEENYLLIIKCFEYIETYIQNSNNYSNLHKQLLNRILFAVVNVAITGYFNPCSTSKDPIKGMTEYMEIPLVDKAIKSDYTEGLGLQRKIILKLLLFKQWWALSLLGKLRRIQLGSK